MKLLYRQTASDDIVHQFRYYLLTAEAPEIALRLGRTLSNNLFHSSSSSGEDTCCKRSGGQNSECYFWTSQTRRDSGRDRAFPSRPPASTEAFQNLQGLQGNRSRETKHSASGISGSSPCPECCCSQAALAFESLLWSGVSGHCERNVSTTLCSLVGTTTNRIPCTRVSVQCDSNRHGDRHAHL